MKTSKALAIATFLIILAVLALLSLAMYMEPKEETAPVSDVATPVPTATVHYMYMCDLQKTIDASFYEGTSSEKVVTGEMPKPSGWAEVSLSGASSIHLPQTISADGGRYANADESLVFWSKGRGAMVLEGGKEKNYTHCIEVVANPNMGTVYHNGKEGITLRYPKDYTVNESYKYQALGPGKEISGVSFTIPARIASGTNLSTDSKISIEFLSANDTHDSTSECDAKLFVPEGVKSVEMSDGDMTYSVASTNDAGAGNRYEEKVYTLPGTNPCIALRYFIHYGAIENYAPGDVREFDKAALISEFDSIRRTLVVVQ